MTRISTLVTKEESVKKPVAYLYYIPYVTHVKNIMYKRLT